MLILSEQTVLSSFVNASRKEVNDLTLPADFADIDWQRLDYFGWRDPKRARRSYIVVPVAGEPLGVLLQQAEASPRSRAQCSWCHDVTLPNDVVMFSARRRGAAGRNGNTVATLVCENFECSANVRKLPPVAYLGFDAEAARLDRIEGLKVRAAMFVMGINE